MSLIIEALKRARDDAVRRQAAAKGLPLAPVPRLQGKSRWLTLAIVPLAAALVVCLLLLFDLYTRLPRAAETAPTPRDSATLPLPSGPSQAASEGAETESTSLPPRDAGSESLPEATRPAPGEQGAPVTESAEMPASPPLSSAPPSARPGTSSLSVGQFAAPARATATGVREFVGQARLIDGQLLDLEGIAWSESEPFALINGQVVGVGEWIRSYRVTGIQQDRVHLEQGEDRVLLRLK